MNTNPRISIITACRNNAQTIESAILSVQGQKAISLEHIVVDGASTDRTVNIIRRYSDKIAHLISEPDNGIYDALNKGIKLAKGEYIAFLHADDFLAYPNALSEAIEQLETSNAQGVYADLMYVSKLNPDKIIRYWKSGSFNRDELKKGWMPPHPTLILGRELYDNLGAFDTSFRISADYDLMLRMLWTNKVVLAYLPKVTYKMRVGGASNGSFRNIVLKSQEDLRALRRNNLPALKALFFKNFRKISQFWKKEQAQ